MVAKRACLAAAVAFVTVFAGTRSDAITITGEAVFDVSGEAIITGPIFSDPGTYRYSFTLDRAAPAEIFLFAQETYNWYGVDDGIYYGGDDVPIEPIYSFLTPGTEGEGLFTLQPPYEHFYPGDPAIHELGFYFMTDAQLRLYGAFGDDPIRYVFSAAPLSPVPEAQNWALMIAGFGLVGAGLRRRRYNFFAINRYRDHANASIPCMDFAPGAGRGADASVRARSTFSTGERAGFGAADPQGAQAAHHG